MAKSPAVTIGPALPEGLSITRANASVEGVPPEAETDAPFTATVTEGVTEESHVDGLGNLVTTRVGIAKRKVESVADVAARAKSSYTDALGNKVETY